MDQARDIHVLEGLKADLLGVEVLAQVAAVVQNRAAQVALRVAALLRMAAVDVVVRDEAVAPVLVHEVHQLAHEYRRDRRIGDPGAHVHLDGHGLAVHLVAQAALFQQARELLRQGLAGLVARVGHGCEQYVGWHANPPPLSSFFPYQYTNMSGHLQEARGRELRARGGRRCAQAG